MGAGASANPNAPANKSLHAHTLRPAALTTVSSSDGKVTISHGVALVQRTVSGSARDAKESFEETAIGAFATPGMVRAGAMRGEG